MNLLFIAPIAKKYPALGRFLESIIIGSGTTMVLALLASLTAYLQDGNTDALTAGVGAAILGFALSVTNSISLAIGKWQRDQGKLAN